MMSRPPSEHEKEALVESVFSSIVPRYDLLNAALSLGMHAAWRRFAVSKLNLGIGAAALDVCCGTGDLAFEMARSVGESGRVVGIDFSVPMIEEAVRKSSLRRRGHAAFCAGKADELPFADGVFDGAGIAFGLRNVPDVGAALSEMARVVRPGGRVVSLEIVGVKSGLAGVPWRLYFHVIAPRVARILGGRRQAYDYLSQSVAEFMSASELVDQFRGCGLRDVVSYPLVMGGVCVHVGVR
jgi:demethylmenaquinone methyltransferase / 2-methoxy-6-polyprenyl-1,4-benzoquinol methylase